MHRVDLNREVLAGDVLAQVAEGTGGEFFHNNNDLKGGFGRLAGSPGAYILAFAPKDLKPDGKLHELKVTLAEKETGYGIQARRSYFAPRNEAEAKAEARPAKAAPTYSPDQPIKIISPVVPPAEPAAASEPASAAAAAAAAPASTSSGPVAAAASAARPSKQ